MFLVKTTLNHQLHLWLLRLLWLRHSLTPAYFKKLAIKLGIAYGVIVAVQFLYPSRLVLPQTQISGKYYGFQSVAGIARQLNGLNGKTLTVSAAEKTFDKNLSELGLKIDGTATAKEAAKYDWKLRFIPFSLLAVRHNQETFRLIIDEPALSTFTSGLKQYDRAPINAAVAIKDTTVEVVPSASGYSYDPEKVAVEVKEEGIDSRLSVRVTPSVVPAPVTTPAADEVKSFIDKRLGTPLSIEADGNLLEIDPSVLASWMVTNPDPATGKVKVDYDRSKIKTKLRELSSKVYIAESPNKVVVVDGETAGSKNGSSGQVLLLEETIDDVIGAVNSQANLVIAKLQSLSPSTQFTRTYTRSSKGITALLAYWSGSHSGQYGIFMKTVDGQIVASFNPDKQFTSASIYKLYVAYIVYNKIEKGELSLSDSTSTGANVGDCMEVMIVRSDNECAVALGSKIGWNTNDGMLKAIGIKNTTLASLNQLTTASDVATWLFSLQDGSLIKEDNSKSLLSMMSRQIYRKGIPAGSDGSVANKVGFLWDLNHDAAIVYHPKGSYVLAVLSSGSSFGNIADLARQISDVMNQ